MKIQKVEYALGSNIFDIKKYLGKNYKRVLETTGIKKTYHASRKEDIISLALKASKKVLQNERNIDAIILISQTPKYNIPPNSFIIQNSLGIKKNSLVLDINHGCSGYIYGLKIASCLMETKNIKKILLITTDNYSRYLKKLNVKVLFSDCATASLLVKSKNKPKFEFFSNGKDYRSLAQESSNYIKSINQNSIVMDGKKVYNFSVNEVPKIFKSFIKENKLNIKDFDFILLHQASKIVNENIKNKISHNMKIFLDNYDKFGNTVSSSIPLLISKNFKKLKNKKVLLCGFGVGLSIGICDHEF